MGFYAGNQLRWIEGLDDIIISAQAKALDLIFITCMGRYKQNGNIALFPNLLADSKAIFVW